MTSDKPQLSRRCFSALAGGGALSLIAGFARADYTGVPRTFLWNPNFNDLVDTAKYKKNGPYTIGFANASQADLWLVTFTHGVQFAAAKWCIRQVEGYNGVSR